MKRLLSRKLKSGVPYQQVGIKKAVCPTSKWELKKLRVKMRNLNPLVLGEKNEKQNILLYGKPKLL